MARLWVRGNTGATLTSAGLGVNHKLYQNARATVSSDIVLTQKVTAVATHLMAVEDTGDLWILRMLVTEESVTPAASVPEDEDVEVKGVYPCSHGPVYFSPARLISVPVESTLWLQVNKVAGGNSSTVRVYFNVLLSLSLG